MVIALLLVFALASSNASLTVRCTLFRVSYLQQMIIRSQYLLQFQPLFVFLLPQTAQFTKDVVPSFLAAQGSTSVRGCQQALSVSTLILIIGQIYTSA